MNFCSGCLDPSVSTNQPGADGKDVSNLISQTPGLRNFGYMAEYFIRPPVDITFEFVVPIDISHVKLFTKLERHSSTGFVIFTQPENSNAFKTEADQQRFPSVIGANSGSNFAGDTFKSFSIPGSSSKSPSNEPDDNNVYLRVGSYFTQNEDCVILKNPHYKHWLKLKIPANVIETDKLSIYKGILKHNNRLALRCVKRMIVRISRTFESSRPVLKAIEVWGQPGITAKNAARKKIICKWLSRSPEEVSAPALPRMYNSKPDEQKPDVDDKPVESKDSFEIPEDFLDPLTCEVMTIPLLLPSGHSIDAQVLERFITNEALWGRPASDPFTGVPFKPGQKPSPNVSLKARIDRFLAINADHPEVQTCGRTLGGSSMNFFESDDGVYNQQSYSKIMKRTFNGEAKYKSTTVRSGCSSQAETDEIVDKRTKSNVESNKFGNAIQIPRTSSVTLKQNSKTRILPTSANAQKLSSHHGLIHMIGSALTHTQQRPNRVKPLNDEKPTSLIHGEAKRYETTVADIFSKNSPSCTCGAKIELYRVPCEHILCRKCLLQLQNGLNMRCQVCDQVFKSSDVIRFHEKSIFS